MSTPKLPFVPMIEGNFIWDRFWSKVNKTDTCWLWTAGITSAGYGQFKMQGSLVRRYAHRLSYEVLVGPIPHGLHILHSCDVPACVNPAHLSVGTQADNMRDCALKGRARGPRLGNEPMCGRGLHLMSSENIYRSPNGWRRCRACAKAAVGASRERRLERYELKRMAKLTAQPVVL